MPCQPHAIKTCAGASHLYVQKYKVMLLTIREVRISRGIFRDAVFPSLLFDERNKVRPYVFFIITHRYNLVQGKWIEDAFICSGYRHLVHDCTMHHIPTAKIEATILAVIQRVSWYVRHNEKEFTERVREASDQNQEKTVKECQQKINKAQKRYKELDGLVKKLYEGNATGKIPDKHFTRLLNEYDEEQTGLETSIAEWQRQIENWNADKLKTDQFIQLVKRYTDFSELTTPMLNEFIEKVIVHEGEGRGNDRRQRIDIYLNFIGAFEVPAHIVTPAEVEEQRRQQEEQVVLVYKCGQKKLNNLYYQMNR